MGIVFEVIPVVIVFREQYARRLAVLFSIQ